MCGQYVVIYQQYIDQSFDLTMDLLRKKLMKQGSLLQGKGQGINHCCPSLGFPGPLFTFNHPKNLKTTFYLLQKHQNEHKLIHSFTFLIATLINWQQRQWGGGLRTKFKLISFSRKHSK